MLKAEIVNPMTRKAKIDCSVCHLFYSARDYKILYENEKLAFFKIKFPKKRKKTYCHDCLYKSVAKLIGPLPSVDLEMTTMESTIVVTFYKKGA
jgi:hypothetical protein